MAAIAAANVTYTINKRRRLESGLKFFNVSVAFGNGALTYPSGGVPLTAASLGCPSEVQSVTFVDASNSDGYIYKWSKSTNCIRIYQGDNANTQAAPAVELTTAATPAATTLVCEVVGW